MKPAEFRPAQNYDTNPYYDNAEWPGPGYVETEELAISENGTYTAPEGKAYSPVTVNVSGGGGGGIQEATITFDATFPSSDYIIYIRAQSGSDYPATTAWRFDTSGWFFNAELMQDIMEEYDGKIYATMLNGSGSFQITDGDNVSVSGDATYDGETHIVTFTGDCTVSVTAIKP